MDTRLQRRKRLPCRGADPRSGAVSGDWPMRLTKLAEESDLLHIQCEGEISQMHFKAEGDPLERLLDGGYGRKILLNLERTSFIDSSGISWLVLSQKQF